MNSVNKAIKEWLSEWKECVLCEHMVRENKPGIIIICDDCSDTNN